jgi:hypothetical protein
MGEISSHIQAVKNSQRLWCGANQFWQNAGNLTLLAARIKGGNPILILRPYDMTSYL